MKKAARDELPHLESDWAVELGYRKMANRPERKARQETRATDGLQSEDSDVYADQYSCEARHKNSLTASGHLHTKVTNDHHGPQCYGDLVDRNDAALSKEEERTRRFALFDNSRMS